MGIITAFLTGCTYIVEKDYSFGVTLVCFLLYIAVIALFSAIGFWLFIWAIFTLFHFTIAYTWINFWAYIVFTGFVSSSPQATKK